MDPPSWIGDVCLFKDMVRAKTVVAVTHSELLSLTKSAVLSVTLESAAGRQNAGTMLDFGA